MNKYPLNNSISSSRLTLVDSTSDIKKGQLIIEK